MIQISKYLNFEQKNYFYNRIFCRLDFVDYFCTANGGRGDSENPLPLNIFN